VEQAHPSDKLWVPLATLGPRNGTPPRTPAVPVATPAEPDALTQPEQVATPAELNVSTEAKPVAMPAEPVALTQTEPVAILAELNVPTQADPGRDPLIPKP
jgi:hypothetical protein